MPCYYFKLTDGKQVVDTRAGLDLPGLAAARDEAARLARDLSEHQTLRDLTLSGWQVSIIDEGGNQLDAVPIVKAEAQ